MSFAHKFLFKLSLILSKKISKAHLLQLQLLQIGITFLTIIIFTHIVLIFFVFIEDFLN